MALESATYIHQLITTNPGGGDQKSQGDDHIKLLKSTLKNTFPNVAGAVNPSHTELNYLVGVTSAVQDQLDAKVDDSQLGNTSGKVPLNNGSVNTNLNADKWDGAHLIVRTSDPTSGVGSDGDFCIVRES